MRGNGAAVMRGMLPHGKLCVLQDPYVSVSPATQGLIDEVAERGGAIAWAKSRGVCCTVEEEESAA